MYLCIKKIVERLSGHSPLVYKTQFYVFLIRSFKYGYVFSNINLRKFIYQWSFSGKKRGDKDLILWYTRRHILLRSFCYEVYCMVLPERFLPSLC